MSAVREAVLRAKARRSRRSRRGVALIMVLGAITILTVFLTELQEETSADLSAAIADRDGLRAEYYARSGINLGRLLIATEPTIRRAVAPLFMMMQKRPPQIPVWEFSDMVLGPFNDEIGAEAFGAMSGLDLSTGKNLGLAGGGHFQLTIVDEDAKININSSVRDLRTQLRLAAQLLGLIGPQQYNPLFEGRDPDGQFSDRATVCGALVDWADFDENLFACDPFNSNAGSSGQEDNYYQVLGLDYMRKNAAYDSLEEMRLVRGVSDTFWATFVDPEPRDPKKRIMTVWGQGKINVNNANAQTLLAIVCGDAPLAGLCTDPVQTMAFIQGVTLAKGLLQGAPVFTSEKDFTSTMEGKGLLGPVLASLGVQPVQWGSAKEVQKAITTESKMFSLYADGIVPGYRRETHARIHAVVDIRTAKEIGGGLSLGSLTSSAAPNGTNVATPAKDDPAAPATPEEIAAALATNPAGNVVYWRVE